MGDDVRFCLTHGGYFSMEMSDPDCVFEDGFGEVVARETRSTVDEFTPKAWDDDAIREEFIDGGGLQPSPLAGSIFDDWLAAHDREVAAKALRDAADTWHAANAGTSPRAYQWLWDRADRIEKGTDHDPR